MAASFTSGWARSSSAGIRERKFSTVEEEPKVTQSRVPFCMAASTSSLRAAAGTVS